MDTITHDMIQTIITVIVTIGIVQTAAVIVIVFCIYVLPEILEFARKKIEQRRTKFKWP